MAKEFAPPRRNEERLNMKRGIFHKQWLISVLVDVKSKSPNDINESREAGLEWEVFCVFDYSSSYQSDFPFIP